MTDGTGHHETAPGQKKRDGAQFVRFFGPLLDALRSLGGSGAPNEVVDRIAQDLRVPDAIQNETLPSGELRFRHQVHWARFYLAREGFIDASTRGVWSLTEKGRATRILPDAARELCSKWARIDQEQRRAGTATAKTVTEPLFNVPEFDTDPYETSVLKTILALSPSGFERLAQRILRESGFVQVTVTGSSGDGGIDGFGTLEINPLVSLKVLFQCKKYAKAVSPSHVRDFRGAMAGRADKGIILTTGTFTTDARREASREGVHPIELIDGERLVKLLKKFELGLKRVDAFEIDHRFFDEFREQ